MINDIKNKIENICLQECFLLNRSFWKEVINSLDTYMKWRQYFQNYVKSKT